MPPKTHKHLGALDPVTLLGGLDLGRPAEWQEYRCFLWNRQLHALDQGEEIALPLAGRPCLVRLNPNPTREQKADAEGKPVL